ncbi:MAG: 1-deoxy-D-xylulose-5-phosphate synthase [Bacteroidales bacterium]|jgi:1-deoxy-D-xylulose-5-phosphate synthase|nr:1-deoxy-D-xylulose-5-phosphate synthase [Bacteroidales bacterium]
MKYLSTVNSPADLKKLKVEELPQLCEELREYIISETASNPGHLGSSLGTVELTVAIHYVFDTPNDKLVWDVGHQAYAHKIITGRREQFHTNRKYQGISGFPVMKESEYDAFGTGHASTSISAILGMAQAAKLSGDTERNHIAVIGDASIGGGMAFEAINEAGIRNVNMLVILNDNKMAIDDNRSAMSKYLLHITSSPSYNNFKTKVWNFFTSKRKFSNKIAQWISNVGSGIKGFLLSGSNLFQSLGFRYFGPTNGHDVKTLVKTLRDLKSIPGPKLLHVITVKGKGLKLAEEHQTTYHAPGKFNPETGQLIKSEGNNQPPKYQDVFGETILEFARQDEKVVGITPAMATGCSLTIMDAVYPDRVFDVGIAEQHAVTFSAGLAVGGMVPFCNVYSTFLQRSYDQIVHDVALQKLPVIFCIDRGGVVGEDGATHQGIFDLAFLRSIPNMIIASPLNEHELRNMMFTAWQNASEKGLPFAVRYPRGRGVLTDWKNTPERLEIGKGRVLQEGSEVAVLSLGPLGNNVTAAIELLKAEHINPTHVDMRFLKPLDEDLLAEVAAHHKVLITIEDGVAKGGLFSAVSEYLSEHHLQNRLCHIAINDCFVPHGDVPSLYKELGFDAESIAKLIRIEVRN